MMQHKVQHLCWFYILLLALSQVMTKNCIPLIPTQMLLIAVVDLINAVLRSKNELTAMLPVKIEDVGGIQFFVLCFCQAVKITQSLCNVT